MQRGVAEGWRWSGRDRQGSHLRGTLAMGRGLQVGEEGAGPEHL